MSLPTEFDFAVIQIGDGGSPTETFSIICGMKDVTVNFVANSADRFVRDCAKPGEVPVRKVKATGKQLDVTGTGLTDKATVATLLAALGKVKNYKVLGYADDDTDTGTLLGTLSGAFMLLSDNLSLPRDDAAGVEITLANHGAWTWTAA